MSDLPTHWDAANGRREDIMTEAGFGPQINRSKLAVLRLQFPVFFEKNKGLASNPDFWRMLPRMAKQRRKMRGQNTDGTRMIVATHHKAMTTYFNAVLRLFAYASGVTYEKVLLEQPLDRSKVILSNHGKMDFPALAPYRCVHLMRDPRDMIVSGYHYHKWTYEAWAMRPDENGQSYQDKLNSVDKKTGLFMEIDHFVFFYRELLENWDMDDPDTLEVSYEGLMGEGRDALYRDIFEFFGCEGEQLDLGVDLMRLFEAKSRTGRSEDAAQAKHSHIRSGRSEQWRKELDPAHLAYIEAQLGPVLRKFGYDPA